MPLSVVPVSRHISLGTWGTLELSGETSALVRPSLAGDFELPEAIARDLTAGMLLLNDEVGRLIYLPYEGELIGAYDLTSGEAVSPPIELSSGP